MDSSEPKSTPFDPGQQQLGTVYAKALLGVTEKAGNTDQVLEEFGAVRHEVLQALPQLRASLESPRIAVEVKERLLDKAFGGRMSGELLNFLKVTARHGRLDCLGAIHDATYQMANEMHGRVAATVKTATELSDELRERIRARLAESLGRDVMLDCRVDPELLGGIQVQVGDTVFDGSVANRLVKLQKQTLDQTGHAIRHAVDRFVSQEQVDGDPSA